MGTESKRYRNASDQDEHEQNISSLFGLFYALLCKQVPCIAEKSEKVMLESGMPRLDKNDLQQFSLPFTDHPVTFEGHPLAPPEGYMAITGLGYNGMWSSTSDLAPPALETSPPHKHQLGSYI